ncbi:phage tail assembly chaperone [Thioclava nitratireducens]|uniref:phage tail assembly chaperone n=1 Tax=Thioclava nitratireducens TaxID=1915078 RepID=UPI000989D983|nr:phage tail assembly chaperone [Thioclava nitratireducens]
MQPAYECTIRHGDLAVTLRASLRAAITLEQAFGFAPLFRRIHDQNFTAYRAVIEAAATDRREADALLRSLSRVPLRGFVEGEQARLMGFCAALLPQAPEGERQEPESGASKPWAELFQDLYRLGTGWLEWTPSETWNASPSEIIAAVEAHSEKLVALAGGAREETRTTEDNKRQREANIAANLDPEFDREGLNRLKAKLRSEKR